MKKLLTILIFIFSVNSFAQDFYFLGKTNYCTPKKAESKKQFDVAILSLQFPKYYGGATNMLMKTIEEDKEYCDAYFMAGYLFRLQNMEKEAVTLYYMADSLAQNKAPIFKMNLAVSAFRLGAMDLARKKYQQMTTYFPENPEGYYGIANTSIIIGDFDNGLNNLKTAEKLYQCQDGVKKDVKYLFGILYAFKEEYKTALPYLEDVFSTYKRDDGYLATYVLTQMKVAVEINDEKLKNKAKKNYEKIKNKNTIPDDLKNKLKDYFS